MKINGCEITAKQFAYEGCHKIYLLDDDDVADAIDTGYDIYPIEQLEGVFDGSCELRFISNWKLDKQYVAQFEEALFKGKP